MPNEIEVVITGKDKGATKVMTDTHKSAEKMGEGFDKAGEGADNAESKLIGLHDTVDGLHTIMQGPGEQGMVAYIQGFADLAGGVATFVIPALKTLSKAMIESALQHVRAAATMSLAWLKMAAQATLSALRMAASWFIALGPVAWAIAGLVAFGYTLAVLWGVVRKHMDAIKGAFAAVWNWVKANWPYLIGMLAGPIGVAAVYIARHWDQVIAFVRGLPGRMAAAGRGLWDWIKGSFRAAINAIIDWWNGLEFRAPKVHIPGTNIDVGGFTIDLPDLPHLRGGGIVRARPGGTAIIAGEGGQDEAIVPLGAGLPGAPVVIELHGDGTRLTALLMEIIREAVRVRGGNVQTVIGSA